MPGAATTSLPRSSIESVSSCPITLIVPFEEEDDAAAVEDAAPCEAREDDREEENVSVMTEDD